MFQFSGFPHLYLFIQHRLTGYCPVGFPHSDIRGSMLICSSPRLFAACHVLLRLLMPRHSPCALLRLTSSAQADACSAFASPQKLPLAWLRLLFPKNALRWRFSGTLNAPSARFFTALPLFPQNRHFTDALQELGFASSCSFFCLALNDHSFSLRLSCE